MQYNKYIFLHILFVINILYSNSIQEFEGYITEYEHVGGTFCTQVPWYAAVATYEAGGVTFTFPPSFQYDILPVVQITVVQQSDATKRVDIRVSHLTKNSVTVHAYNGRGVECSSDDTIQIHILVISDYV